MSEPSLKLSSSLSLPLDLVTEATAIVATRGAGKTSASVVIVEEASKLGVQSVILDRTGVYWGLRSNVAGDGPGLPTYILGGPRGDVPLQAAAGSLIADLVVDSGHSLVLDLSDFSKADAVRFSAAFLERLYDRKARARSTTLVVIDEAHFYAPQTPRGGFKGDSAKLMGAMEDVVGLGRSRGLGVILTTQRTQALNKAVLDLIETLLVMRMLSPRARDAVKAWLGEKHEDDELGIIQSLDGLPTGTAWVWSPLRHILEQVAIRRIKTFDSYATPKPGETRSEPSARKQLDLTALGEQIAATAEKAKENDPVELRKRLRDLEAKQETAIGAVEAPWRAEADRLKAQVADLEAQLAVKPAEAIDEKQIARLEQVAGELGKLTQLLVSSVTNVGERADNILLELARLSMAAAPALPRPIKPPPRPIKAAQPTYELGPGRSPNTDGYELGKAELTILGVLAEYPDGRTHNELAFLAGYSAKASTVGVSLSTLRRQGLVEPGQPIRATAAGLEAAGGVRDRPRGQALLDQWLQHPRMGDGERRVLLTLVEHGELSHEQLAEATGYSPTASTVGVILSKLRKLGLVEKGRRDIAPEFREAIER
ncbi:MAG TPA: helicase HerA-like domain-containing protein [Gaiellaceae bacterium]|jgi:hypothetical protein|nr:helicase HerA-like domain-containing protein [Gaiellaceae bacterium]